MLMPPASQVAVSFLDHVLLAGLSQQAGASALLRSLCLARPVSCFVLRSDRRPGDKFYIYLTHPTVMSASAPIFSSRHHGFHPAPWYPGGVVRRALVLDPFLLFALFPVRKIANIFDLGPAAVRFLVVLVVRPRAVIRCIPRPGLGLLRIELEFGCPPRCLRYH